MDCNISNVIVDIDRLDRKLDKIQNSISMNLHVRNGVILNPELFETLRYDLDCIRFELTNLNCDEQ
jgi:hypothetical protein